MKSPKLTWPLAPLAIRGIATSGVAAGAAASILFAAKVTVAPPVVLVCAACHGRDGNSVDPDVPSLAGQVAPWLERPLIAFKTRRCTGVNEWHRGGAERRRHACDSRVVRAAGGATEPRSMARFGRAAARRSDLPPRHRHEKRTGLRVLPYAGLQRPAAEVSTTRRTTHELPRSAVVLVILDQMVGRRRSKRDLQSGLLPEDDDEHRHRYDVAFACSQKSCNQRVLDDPAEGILQAIREWPSFHGPGS